PSLVPFHLIEVSKRGPSRPSAPAQRGELVVRDLTQGALDAEPRQIEILLVDDRRDAWIDLDHAVADELDVEEPFDRELLDDLVRDLHERVVLQRHEVHREAGAHRLARLRMAENDARAVGDAVDRALTAGGEL